MARIHTHVASFVFAASLALAGPSAAYSPMTHFEISLRAARASSLDRALKERFGEPFGRRALLNGVRMEDRIAYGGWAEDDPERRALHHFHQPLASWLTAGIFGFSSSVRWQQDPTPPTAVGGGHWSWPVARRRFADYLTTANEEERNRALSDVGRALGQMMHLIQDATSPAHTRNDTHYFHDSIEAHLEAIRFGGGAAARGRFDSILSGNVVYPDEALFTSTGDTAAPNRIARLIDSDRFNGTIGTYSTGGLIGASEYTNGGYVSDDTIFSSFALPRISSIDRTGFFDPPAGMPGARKYYPKIHDGDPVSHFVAEGTLTEQLQFWNFLGSPGYVVDGKTVEAAAKWLVPRAVGYSAGLIDEFLREQIEIAAPAQHVYGRTTYQPDKPDLGFGQFKKLKLKIRNVKPDILMGAGTLTVIARYRKLAGAGAVDSFKEPAAPIFLAMNQAKAAPIAVTPGTSFQELEADFTAEPIPVNAVDLRLIAVFRGPVGAEQEAVAFGARDLAEPDPIDYTNGTDWECFKGALYRVTDPLYADVLKRDLDGDDSVDLVGPSIDRGVKVKAGPTSPLLIPSDTFFDWKVPELSAVETAQVGRSVILQDRNVYAFIPRSDAIFDPVFNRTRPGMFSLFHLGAVINDIVELPQLGLVHRSTTSGKYRGIDFFHMVILVQEGTIPCFSALFDKTPNAILVASPPLEVAP